jgi:hypothetical protein
LTIAHRAEFVTLGSDPTFAASRSNVRSTFLRDLARNPPLSAGEIASDCCEGHSEPRPLCAVIVVGDEAVLFKKPPRRVRRPSARVKVGGFFSILKSRLISLMTSSADGPDFAVGWK